MRPRRFVVVAAPLVAACSLVTSLDGYTGGESAAARDATVTDGPSTVDASDSGDAGNDASWCALNAPDATLCADFESTDLGLFTMQKRNGTVAVEPGDASSPPNALTSVASPTAAQSAVVGVAYTDLGVASSVTLAFDVLVDRAPAGLAFAVAQLSVANWYIEVLASDTAITLAEYNANNDAYNEPYTSPALPLGRWTRLAVTVSFTPTPRASLDIQGTRVLTDTPLSPPVDAGAFFVQVGAPYNRADASTAATRVDNIVYERR